MEKLHEHRFDWKSKPILDNLLVAYEPLTLARPMKLFPARLGLTPGVPGIPASDYLAELLLGHRSVQAALRRELGDVEFRNLRNYALGRKSTQGTRSRLLARMGGNEEFLEGVAEHFRNPEQSGLTKLLQAGEGALLLLLTVLLGSGATCAHCGKKMVTPQESWWARQPCVLAPAEFRFLDRLLYVPVALAQLPRILLDGDAPSLSCLGRLSSPDQLPFQHWLDLLVKAYSSPDLAHLAVRARVDDKMTGTVYRIHSGAMLTESNIDLLTQELVGGANRIGTVRRHGRAVRRIAFAVDFLQAAHADEQVLEPAQAQKIVHDRLVHLCDDLLRVIHAPEHQRKKAGPRT
ncbi:hypothetical protein LZ009_05380 [Ramlibacter sp. XY19]|uniref:hypothetical protein n=1 Tax=Ramlibacter paludis TaxID=2908000 RepID=UPI0023DC2D44|nr:hypothetical protein [Ramlibacter paludis]MCG2592208.1 hypothetical protein [Ramlibacter paludis]